MKLDNIVNSVKSGFRKHTFKVRQASPQLLIVAGVAGLVAGTVLACKATTKLPEILEEETDELELDEEMENDISEEEEDDEPELKTKARKALKVAKLYAPAVAVDIASILLIFKGTQIFKNRQAALCAAYAALDAGYKNYRKRVIEEYGEDADRKFHLGLKQAEVKEKVTDENGKSKTVKKTYDIKDPTQHSVYARYFDEASPYWKKDAAYNHMFVQMKQNEFNVRLQAEGFVFLNDVYEAFGLPKTRAGQVVGWRYNEENPTGDNYIDFGIFNVYREDSIDFINDRERNFLLDFNVDGPIIDYMTDEMFEG